MVQICPFCENGVEITEITSHPDYTRRFFSCGHMAKPTQGNNNTDSKNALNHTTLGPATGEESVDISPIAAIVISRLKQSKKDQIKEKIFNRKPCLQFSAESLRLVITNEIMNVHLLETKFTENISAANILESISALRQEVRTNSVIDDRERKKMLSLFEKLNAILVSKPARTLLRRKWTFSVATPYILKIIEVLVGSSTDNFDTGVNNKNNRKTSV
ncbi:MAG: hypothetical protein ACR2IS_14800 [Nitrososphaeraceae archaeon]